MGCGFCMGLPESTYCVCRTEPLREEIARLTRELGEARGEASDLRSAAKVTRREREALRARAKQAEAEVERLREAHRRIGSCPCEWTGAGPPPDGPHCGECASCIARAALRGEG